MNSQELVKTINSISIPNDLMISDTTWRYLLRSALRGKNVLMIGPSGSGKTTTIFRVAETLKRNDKIFLFNLGSTQDVRSSLIGNTHYSKEEGTFFSNSLFVQAIQQEGAIIVLDEISRANPEAWNILMSVIDPNQRFLRIDEAVGAPTIKVANGVSFFATANIGFEYTSTRQLDRALLDRFTLVKMEPLDSALEARLLKHKFPNVDSNIIETVTKITKTIRSKELSTAVSTRVVEEMISLIEDGFTIAEAVEHCVYPLFYAVDTSNAELDTVKTIVNAHSNLNISNVATGGSIFNASHINS